MEKYDENIEKLIDEFRKFQEDDEDIDEQAKKLALKKSKPLKAVAISIYATVFASAAVLGLVMPLRPTVSELEKRNLEEFPEFSMETFVSGEYFSKISLWYSDTYPFRENLFSVQNSIKSLYGINTGEQIIGDIQVADLIPETPPQAEPTISSDETEPQESVSVIGGDISLETSPNGNNTEELVVADSPYDAEAIEPAGTVYVAGNSAYGMFYFNLNGINAYMAAMNSFADHLGDTCNIYAMIVPTSTGVMLSDEQRASFGCSSQGDVISYLYSGLSDKIKTINVFDTMMAHRDEYIYFRTDHHWTIDGAYYAYELYLDAVGMTPVAKESLEKVTFEGFLGTYYSSSNQNAALAQTPDTVDAYLPTCPNTMIYYNSDMSVHTWPIIKDMSESGPYNTYTTFIAGDHAITVLGNPYVTNGKSAIVFKDSFANPFVTLLINNYSTIYVVDNRYIAIDVKQFCEENNISDCILFYAVDSLTAKTATYLTNNIVK